MKFVSFTFQMMQFQMASQIFGVGDRETAKWALKRVSFPMKLPVLLKLWHFGGSELTIRTAEGFALISRRRNRRRRRRVQQVSMSNQCGTLTGFITTVTTKIVNFFYVPGTVVVTRIAFFGTFSTRCLSISIRYMWKSRTVLLKRNLVALRKDGIISLFVISVPDFLSSSFSLLLNDLVSSERPNI